MFWLNNLDSLDVEELVSTFVEDSESGGLTNMFDSRLFVNTMKALEVIIDSYTMKTRSTRVKRATEQTKHVNETLKLSAFQKFDNTSGSIVRARSLNLITKTSPSRLQGLPPYNTGLNHEIFSKKGVQRRSGAVPQYINFLKKANSAKEEIDGSSIDWDNRRMREAKTIDSQNKNEQQRFNRNSNSSKLNKRKMWLMTLKALRQAKKPKPWLEKLNMLVRKMRNKVLNTKSNASTNSQHGSTKYKNQSMKSNECECPTRKGLEQLLGFIPIAVIVGYTTTVSASAAVSGGTSTGSSSSGSTSTTTVTVNGGNTVTSTNTNTPTVTNTDNDVITTSAQANPINTLTNTASNQDNDIITNMATGRSGTGFDFGQSPLSTWLSSQHTVKEVNGGVTMKRKQRSVGESSHSQQNQDPLLGLIYDLLRKKDTNGESCFMKSLCRSVVDSGINRNVLVAASVPIALLLKSHRGGTVTHYQHAMLTATSDRCDIYQCGN